MDPQRPLFAFSITALSLAWTASQPPPIILGLDAQMRSTCCVHFAPGVNFSKRLISPPYHTSNVIDAVVLRLLSCVRVVPACPLILIAVVIIAVG